MNALMAEESDSPLSAGDFEILASDKFFEHIDNASVSPFTNALALSSGIKPSLFG